MVETRLRAVLDPLPPQTLYFVAALLSLPPAQRSLRIFNLSSVIRGSGDPVIRCTAASAFANDLQSSCSGSTPTVRSAAFHKNNSRQRSGTIFQFLSQPAAGAFELLLIFHNRQPGLSNYYYCESWAKKSKSSAKPTQISVGHLEYLGWSAPGDLPNGPTLDTWLRPLLGVQLRYY